VGTSEGPCVQRRGVRRPVAVGFSLSRLDAEGLRSRHGWGASAGTCGIMFSPVDRDLGQFVCVLRVQWGGTGSAGARCSGALAVEWREMAGILKSSWVWGRTGGKLEGLGRLRACGAMVGGYLGGPLCAVEWCSAGGCGSSSLFRPDAEGVRSRHGWGASASTCGIVFSPVDRDLGLFVCVSRVQCGSAVSAGAKCSGALAVE
jgi:hypothetical protein